MTREQFIEMAARVAHEANRAYCLTIGDESQLPWEHAKTWQKESARNGVLGVLAGNGPGASHQSWLDEKRRTGWKWGAEKNEDKKEHPCMVEFDQLPEEQRRKDHIFVNVIRSLMSSLEVPFDAVGKGFPS